MDEKNTTTRMKKELSYDERVIKKIAGIATDDVPGVLTVSGGLIGNITDRLRTDDKTKGIDADVGKRQVALDLNVVCEYGRNVPSLFDEVVGKVGKAVLDMTGLELIELNMHVDDVLNKADFEELRRKINDENASQGSQGEEYVPSMRHQQGQSARVQ